MVMHSYAFIGTHAGVQLSSADVRSGFTCDVHVCLCLCVMAPKPAWGSPRWTKGGSSGNISSSSVLGASMWARVGIHSTVCTTTFYIPSVPLKRNPEAGRRCQVIWSNNTAEGHWWQCCSAWWDSDLLLLSGGRALITLLERMNHVIKHVKYWTELSFTYCILYIYIYHSLFILACDSKTQQGCEYVQFAFPALENQLHCSLTNNNWAVRWMEISLYGKGATEAGSCGVISCPAVTDDISVRLTLH